MPIQLAPTLFLPVESTPRELDYKLNLARLFCREGFDVIIGNPPFIRDELKYRNYKGIFLEKGMNPTPEYYKDLKRKGILLYCLSDEGSSVPAFSVTYPQAVDALKLTEKIFMWGQVQTEDLMRRNNDSELSSKYLVTGYPSFDLSLPKYRDYHSALRPSSLGSGYVLVNLNFASINGYSLEETLQACPSMSPETLETIKKTYEQEEQSFDAFRVWLEAILRKFPQQRFLLRPHPAEKKEVYENITRQHPNAIVSRAGNANQAISGAKLVIHNDCTTALQSYLADVPVISFAYSNIQNIHAHWALAFGAQPKSIEEAVLLISSVLDKGTFDDELMYSIHEEAEATLSQWFHNIGSSTKDIVDCILEGIKSQKHLYQQYILQDHRSLLQKLKLFVRKFMPLHYKVPIASRTALSKISSHDLTLRLKLLNTIDGIEASYRIKKLFPNAYLIKETS